MKKLLNLFANANIILGIILLIIPVVFLLYSGLNKNVSANQSNTEVLTEDVIDPSYKSIIPASMGIMHEDIMIPDFDAVTYGNKIIIPSVGTDGLIYECKTSTCGLDKGVWRLPDFGTPINTESPIVLAAHRWGRDDLPVSGKIKNLFYNLDKVVVGDQVNLLWDGKLYAYQVSATEESNHISHNDDLILVTCKYYNSDIRIIVYAHKLAV